MLTKEDLQEIENLLQPIKRDLNNLGSRIVVLEQMTHTIRHGLHNLNTFAVRMANQLETEISKRRWKMLDEADK